MKPSPPQFPYLKVLRWTLPACGHHCNQHLSHEGWLQTYWDQDVMWNSASWCVSCWWPSQVCSAKNVGGVWGVSHLKRSSLYLNFLGSLEMSAFIPLPWPFRAPGRCPCNTPTDLDSSSRLCPHWSWSTPRTQHRNESRSWTSAGPCMWRFSRRHSAAAKEVTPPLPMHPPGPANRCPSTGFRLTSSIRKLKLRIYSIYSVYNILYRHTETQLSLNAFPLLHVFTHSRV